MGSVSVPAAVQAGVLGLGWVECQTAAELLARPPTARVLHPHLISAHACRKGPCQLPAAPAVKYQCLVYVQDQMSSFHIQVWHAVLSFLLLFFSQNTIQSTKHADNHKIHGGLQCVELLSEEKNEATFIPVVVFFSRVDQTQQCADRARGCGSQH